jgi:hypothetical protein
MLNSGWYSSSLFLNSFWCTLPLDTVHSLGDSNLPNKFVCFSKFPWTSKIPPCHLCSVVMGWHTSLMLDLDYVTFSGWGMFRRRTPKMWYMLLFCCGMPIETFNLSEKLKLKSTASIQMRCFVEQVLEEILRIYTFFICFSGLQDGMQWRETISGMLQLLCFRTLSIILFLLKTHIGIHARPHVCEVF